MRLYVTFQNDGEYPLGYAAEYRECNEKTEKKNKAQNEWARYFIENGEYVEHINHRSIWPDGKVYEWNEVRSEFMITVPHSYGSYKRPDIAQIYDTIPLSQKLKPKIIDNDPREGFKIVDTVSRYSTSNKLWRILDPECFQLEISTANMEEIMMNSIIDHGVIKSKCVWDFGKNGIGKATLKLVS